MAFRLRQEGKKVLCDCFRCGSTSLVSRQLRRRHREKYGIASQVTTSTSQDPDTFMGDLNVEGSNADAGGSGTEDFELSSQDDKLEAPLFFPSELLNSEQDLRETFPYSKVSTTGIPEPYQKNFQWLAWKMRCNVSDRAFNESIDLQDNEYMKLEPCRNSLFRWSGVKAVDIDCCRRGKLHDILTLLKF